MSVALAIFALLSTFFAAQLVSTYRVYSKSKDHSLAEQIASETIEKGRALAYTDLGTNPGNPPGLLPRDSTRTVNGVLYDVTTSVHYTDDPIPGGPQTHANYKRMTVTVERAGAVVADMTTDIAPPNRALLTRGSIRVLTADYALNTPIQNASIDVTGGPSANRSDYSDATGHATYADLLPTTPAKPNYSITASAPNYSVVPEDLPPAPAAQTSLLASQLYSTTIRMFKTVTITANLVRPDGTPFTYPSTATVSSPRGSMTVPVVNGTVSFSNVGSEPVIPSVAYTINATAVIAGNPVTGAPTTKVVPNNYPTDVTSTFQVVMPPPPPKNLTVSVMTSNGTPVANTPVLVTGGDDNVTQSGSTTSTGSLVLPMTPSVLPYTIELPTYGQSQSVMITANAESRTFTIVTTGVNFQFRDGTGAPVPNVPFYVFGGDIFGVYSATSDANGNLTMPLDAAAVPYQILTLTSPSANQRFFVGGPMTYTVLLTDQARFYLTYNGNEIRNMNILITGGDLNVSLSGVTDYNGELRINLPTSVLPYTVNIPAQRGYLAKTVLIIVDSSHWQFPLQLSKP